MTYGGTPPTVTASYSGFENGDGPSSLSGTLVCVAGADSRASAVGGSIYGSSCSGLSDSNYTTSTTSTAPPTVGTATLTITASSGSMTYGGTPPRSPAQATRALRTATVASSLSGTLVCVGPARELDQSGGRLLRLQAARACRTRTTPSSYSRRHHHGGHQRTLTITASTAR